MRYLALSAIFPAGATLWFFVFWHWFDHWRKDRAATYATAFTIFFVLGVAILLLRRPLLAAHVGLPSWIRVVGVSLVAVAMVLGIVADRQIGLHVRTFAPFFYERGRIELETTGAYGLVRHPIYAAGIYYQLGIFLVTGYLVVVAAAAVLALGALWFTRQEERRLLPLLDDPAEYERYRARVPALLPWPRRRRSA